MMQGECASFCKVCPTPCCKISICKEAEESPFLSAVHKRTQAFDGDTGYLGACSCKLSTGRPPVCHAYICSKILDACPTQDHRYALECLGRLVDFVCKGIWKRRHAVEAVDQEDLEAIHLQKFQTAMVKGKAAMEILKSFFQNERALQPEDLQILARIKTLPPQSLSNDV